MSDTEILKQKLQEREDEIDALRIEFAEYNSFKDPLEIAVNYAL